MLQKKKNNISLFGRGVLEQNNNNKMIDEWKKNLNFIYAC